MDPEVTLSAAILRPWQTQLEDALAEEPGKVLWIQNKGTAEGVTYWKRCRMIKHAEDVFFTEDAKLSHVKAFFIKRHKEKMPHPKVVVWDYKVTPKGCKDKTCYDGFDFVWDGHYYDYSVGKDNNIFWVKPHQVVFSKEAPDYNKVSRAKVVHLILQEHHMHQALPEDDASAQL